MIVETIRSVSIAYDNGSVETFNKVSVHYVDTITKVEGQDGKITEVPTTYYSITIPIEGPYGDIE